MVEAKLRVEVLETRNKNLMGDENPFYGNTLVKKVVEESLMHDFDKRKNIAPCGLIATIKVGECVFDIRINRYYLEHESENSYVAFFQVEEKVYEVWVELDDPHIPLINITLSEWLHCGDFEDGDNADNVYKNKDFTTIETLL